MSIDPRAIANETGVPEEDVVAVLDALDEAGTDTDDNGNEDPPAAPLYELVGMLDDDEADRVRERSREFREEFDERVERTRRELSDQNRMFLDTTFLIGLMNRDPEAKAKLDELAEASTSLAFSALTVYEVGIGLSGDS